MISIMATPEYDPRSQVDVAVESELDEIIPMEREDALAMWQECGLMSGNTFQR